MPRQPRKLLSQSYYHIVTRGKNGHTVFRTPADFQHYLDLIQKYKQAQPFHIYHYCLMPNHTHLLVRTKKTADFSLLMKKLALAYYQYYYKNYGWTGHFWQGAYTSQPVGKDNYLIECGKYVELNPLRTGLVNEPEDYQYSSYGYYAFGEPNTLITPNTMFENLGGTPSIRRERYRDLVISGIVRGSYTQPVWGTPTQRYREIQKHRRNLQKSQIISETKDDSLVT